MKKLTISTGAAGKRIDAAERIFMTQGPPMTSSPRSDKGRIVTKAVTRSADRLKLNAPTFAAVLGSMRQLP